MTDHFIKKIEIKDFKCFDNFKAKGFARVNLIGGKNNVGKTIFMEACYVNTHAKDVITFATSLIAIKIMRENLNLISDESQQSNKVHSYLEMNNNIYVETNVNKSHFRVNNSDGIKEYLFFFKDKSSLININDFSFSHKLISNIQFIDNFGFSNSEIIKNYSFVQKEEKEAYLNSILQKLDPMLSVFKVIGDKPQCKIKGKYLELTDMGDGVRHLVSIVISLYSSQGGYLYIDEIDNGIHYSALDNIWNIILKLSKELNVQVFATTHSKECIESYARVAKKIEEQDITYTILSKLKDGSIDAGVYDAKMLFNTLEQDHELRGW